MENKLIIAFHVKVQNHTITYQIFESSAGEFELVANGNVPCGTISAENKDDLIKLYGEKG